MRGNNIFSLGPEKQKHSIIIYNTTFAKWTRKKMIEKYIFSSIQEVIIESKIKISTIKWNCQCPFNASLRADSRLPGVELEGALLTCQTLGCTQGSIQYLKCQGGTL